MIAIKRLQSIMWILVIAVGALAAYLISLRVATERNAVRDMIAQIRQTRSEIRYLEAEFGARANMLQLASWNSTDLGLRVPAPAQYLPDEQALARLDRIEPAAPAVAPPPVMTAMADAAPAAPAAPPPERGVHASDFALIRSAQAAEPPAAEQARATRQLADAAPRRAAAQDPEARRAARLALLDAKLLGEAAEAAAGREIGTRRSDRTR